MNRPSHIRLAAVDGVILPQPTPAAALEATRVVRLPVQRPSEVERLRASYTQEAYDLGRAETKARKDAERWASQLDARISVTPRGTGLYHRLVNERAKLRACLARAKERAARRTIVITDGPGAA